MKSVKTLTTTWPVAEKFQWGATTEQQGPPGQPPWAKSATFQDAVRTLNTLQTNAGYLEQVKHQRGDPQAQLEAMVLYLERSGLQVEDLDRLNIIHVTGTKGKGSTCAFTERILRSYGLKTGFFRCASGSASMGSPSAPSSSPSTSGASTTAWRRPRTAAVSPCPPTSASSRSWPSMSSSRRRWVPAPQHPVSEALGKGISAGGAAPCSHVASRDLCAPCHALWPLQVDLAVVEVGIGGAYDCTNIIRKPVVCGVTSLGIDHTSLLGDTMEKIAWQKGGIFKHGVPAFTVLQPEGPLAVLRDRAQQVSCPLYLCPPLEALEEEGPPLTLGLAGEHQRSNAALALQLARCWLQHQDYQGLGELKASRPNLLWQLPQAPVFQPTSHMRQGLRDTEWLGRTQVLRHGPLTWYLDGAHTASSVQACVRWFRQALRGRERPSHGREMRVLLFNATGDRDPEALLKLLQPCQFDYAVFCPNLTEVSSMGNADQQNFTVTLDQVLLRCLTHQQHWSHLTEEQACPALWGPPSLEPDGPEPHPPHTHSASSLVFSCISHALQWITQGRDPVFQPPSPPEDFFAHPVASSGASALREAAAVHVLVTGSLHLVGGVLRLLEPSLCQ
ncbi:folylpolyglutamate synthase, mitochondrial isoform X4 [Choloepus didactylus]|uniref:folylpolyglutamate synthase, mitochondrial isoform X4 n=1 Tax=Choloepus didactylus TaxID=27675 RepID=UPI00189D94D0|nr:folylpolyglutamate synthase, mitochondrial isoform X4 [Choloepus didactylus]